MKTFIHRVFLFIALVSTAPFASAEVLASFHFDDPKDLWVSEPRSTTSIVERGMFKADGKKGGFLVIPGERDEEDAKIIIPPHDIDRTNFGIRLRYQLDLAKSSGDNPLVYLISCDQLFIRLDVNTTDIVVGIKAGNDWIEKAAWRDAAVDQKWNEVEVRHSKGLLTFLFNGEMLAELPTVNNAGAGISELTLAACSWAPESANPGVSIMLDDIIISSPLEE